MFRCCIWAGLAVRRGGRLLVYLFCLQVNPITQCIILKFIHFYIFVFSKQAVFLRKQLKSDRGIVHT